MPKVRWVMLYRFCSKFHTLSSSAKNFENRLRFDKVTESLKVGTFLRHSVYTNYTNVAYDWLTYNMASATLTVEGYSKWHHCHLMYQCIHSK